MRAVKTWRVLDRNRSTVDVSVGNPTDRRVRGEVVAACVKDLSRKLAFRPTSARSSPEAGAARKRVKVKPTLKKVTKDHTIPPHPGGGGTTRISAKCKKNYGATSFGWDARDDLGASVFLWGPPEYKKRKVAIEVKNLGAVPQPVSLTAVCLAMKFKGL